MLIPGVITITPFFVYSQDEAEVSKKYFLSDLIREIKMGHNIMIAFDPEAIANIESDPNCLNAEDVIGCLEKNHGEAFEIIQSSERKYMLRARNWDDYSLLTGVVWDDQKRPLAYAEVLCPSVNVFAISDEQGSFSLDISNKQVDWQSTRIIISYLGYHPVEMLLKDLISNNHIHLKTMAYPAPMARIHSIKSNISSTAEFSSDIVLQAEFLSKLKNSMSGDLIRNLQILPGVSATNDYSSSFQFRGSNEDQNLLLIGNVPLYQTGHYFNLFSVINDEGIESIKLFRNYLPVSFGDVTESIVQLSPYNSIEIPRQVHVDVSLLTSDIFASIPIGKSLGISMSGRTTNGDIGKGSISKLFSENASALIINTDDGGEIFNRSLQPDIQFQDFMSTLSWVGKSNLTLDAQYIYAHDKATITDAYTIQSRNGRAASTYTYASNQKWTNQGAGLDLTKQWKNRWQSTISSYWSTFDRNDETVSSLTRDRPGLNDPKIDVVQFNLNDAIDDKSLSLSNSIDLSKESQVDFGYQYQNINIDYSIDRNNRDEKFVNRSSEIHTLFANTKFNNKKYFSFELGYRATYSSLAKKFYFSPRIQAFHQVSESWRIKSSAGFYNQQLRKINILSGNNESKSIWTLANDKKVPVLNTTSFMIGGNWINSLFTFDMELYYKRDDNVMQELIPDQSNLPLQQLSALNPLLFIGKGRRYGLDILLKRENINHSSILSYSLSKSDNAFDEYRNGAWIPAADDRRHELNWQHMQHFGKFSLFGALIFASPNPQFKLDQNQQADQPGQYSRNIAYQRIDVGVDYNFQKGSSDFIIGASIFNIFNRQNTASVRYARVDEFQQQQRSTFFTETISLLDRTYNLRFKMTLK